MGNLTLLHGWKAYAAGVGLIGWGIYQIAKGDTVNGANHILLGLGLVGIRHAVARAGS